MRSCLFMPDVVILPYPLRMHSYRYLFIPDVVILPYSLRMRSCLFVTGVVILLYYRILCTCAAVSQHAWRRPGGELPLWREPLCLPLRVQLQPWRLHLQGAGHHLRQQPPQVQRSLSTVFSYRFCLREGRFKEKESVIIMFVNFLWWIYYENWTSDVPTVGKNVQIKLQCCGAKMM